MLKRIFFCGALAGLMMSGGTALAKCTLTLKFTNNNANKITVLGSESQGRVNGGTWAAMDFNNVTLDPGASGSAAYTTKLACGGHAKRDFRIRYEDKGNNVIYMDTSKNDIDVYDGQTLTWTLKHD